MKVFGHGTTTGHGHAINSRESFVELGTLGIDGVELDVRRTADGELVVTHDDRFTTGALVAKTVAADRPSNVLLLGEALDICRGLEVNIELKNHPRDASFDPDERIAELCVDLLDQRDGMDDVLVSCFGLGCIDRVIARRPQTPTALLLLSRRSADEIIDAGVSTRHRAVHPFSAMINGSFMRRCAEFGLRVNAWSTADETDELVRSLIAYGVNGLITESPERALRLRADY